MKPNVVFGRRHAPDTRDKNHLMQAVIPAETDIISKYWDDDYYWGDQGQTPQCVGYAWAHWIENDPITYPSPGPRFDPTYIYNAAQRVDEWPGEDYDGTSVRAGAKVLQSNSFITSYNWAWDADTIARAILTTGPVVVGTEWLENMFYPDPFGVIHPSGPSVGGHAYLLNGYDSETRLFRIKNSWGRSWGKEGHAFISFEDLNSLISMDGEACLAVEQAHPDGDITDPIDPPLPDKDNWFMRLIAKIVQFFKNLF